MLGEQLRTPCVLIEANGRERHGHVQVEAPERLAVAKLMAGGFGQVIYRRTGTRPGPTADLFIWVYEEDVE